jgi:hypothetical protein
LLFGVGQRMPGPGHLRAVLEPQELAPAQVVGDRMPHPLRHPRGDVSARPVRALGCRLGQQPAQFCLQLRRHHRRWALRGRVAAVDHPSRPLLVIALGDLADPVRPVAGHRSERGRGAPLCEQPQDLPPGPFMRLFGRPVASRELRDAQVRGEVYASSPAAILPPPSRIPYERVGRRALCLSASVPLGQATKDMDGKALVHRPVRHI